MDITNRLLRTCLMNVQICGNHNEKPNTRVNNEKYRACGRCGVAGCAVLSPTKIYDILKDQVR